MAHSVDWMAETENAPSAFSGEDDLRHSEEEQSELAEEALPSLDEEKQSSAIEKGGDQQDEVACSFGVKSVALAEYVEALRGLRNMRENHQQETKDEEQDTSADNDKASGVAKVEEQDTSAEQAPQVSKEQLQELPACEPASPSSNKLEDMHNNTGSRLLASEALQTSEVLARRKSLHNQAPHALTARQQPAKKVMPCPVLLVGSQFTKECLLRPGRWVEVGRHPQAHILLQNPAIAKHHCKLQWRKGASSVDLCPLNGVTQVNGRRLSTGTSLSLKHGDLLEIKGKRISFRFLVDMNPCRPINNQLADIRTMSSFAAATKQAKHSLRTPEEDVRRKVQQMRALAADMRQEAIQYEERLTDLQTERSLRLQSLEEEMEKCSLFEKEEQRLEDMLSSLRDEWMERLQKQTIELHKFAAPVNKQTREMQHKRNQIETRVKHEDRRLHPTEHVASLPEASVAKMLPPDFTTRSTCENLPAKAADSNSQEEACFDAPARSPGLEEASKNPALLKLSVKAIQTVAIAADSDIVTLFGDFHSEAESFEQEPKRQRVA